MRQLSQDAAFDDVEELSDRFLHRPLARPLVRLLLPTPVTPNQVTLVSGVAGVAAGISLAFSVDRPSLRLVSAALLFASTVFDCVDGQLARARRTMSPNGMALDTAADIAAAVSMVVAAACVAANVHDGPGVWLLAAVVLVSYGIHCLLFDIVKERYLADHRIEYASSKAVQAEAPRAAGGAMDWIFNIYWRTLAPMIRTSPRQAMSRPVVRAWTLLGPGTHMTCLYVAAATAALWPGALYACLILFATGMNALMLGLLTASGSPLRT